MLLNCGVGEDSWESLGLQGLELFAGVNNVNVSDLPNGVYNIKTKDSVNKLLITK